MSAAVGVGPASDKHHFDGSLSGGGATLQIGVSDRACIVEQHYRLEESAYVSARNLAIIGVLGVLHKVL